MKSNLQKFDLRQEMQRSDYEIARKIDTTLSIVGLHHHEFYEVDYLLSGKVTYTIESRVYPISPGDLLIISPKELHQVMIDAEAEPYERYTLWISPALLDRLSTQETDLASCFDTSRPNYSHLIRLQSPYRGMIQSLLDLLHQESEGSQYGADILPDALLTTLMTLVNRLSIRRDGESSGSFSYTSPAVSDVINYISLHYAEEISLQQLADTFYISKYHLSHEFSHYVGVSVYQYLKKKRLMISCQLLAQGKKSGDVAAACGFCNYTSFYRAFCAEYGVSPREYVHTLQDGTQPPMLL